MFTSKLTLRGIYTIFSDKQGKEIKRVDFPGLQPSSKALKVLDVLALQAIDFDFIDCYFELNEQWKIENCILTVKGMVEDFALPIVSAVSHIFPVSRIVSGEKVLYFRAGATDFSISFID